jgi:O-antigen/teichoic acid export membrane protein
LTEPRAAGSSLVRNVVATLGVRAVWQSFRLVTVLVTAGALGVQAWGAFGLLVSQLDVVRAAANFGLDTAALRWMSLPGASPARVLSRLLRIKASLATLGVAAIGVKCLLDDGDANRWAPLVLASGLFATGATGVMVARVQAAHQAHRLIGAQLVTGGLQLLVALLLARAGAGVTAFCVLMAVSDYVNAGAVAWFSRSLLVKDGSPSPEAPPARAMLAEALPLALVEFAVIAYGRLGVFLVEANAGKVALGQLYAAMKLNDQFLILSGAFAMSALPVMSQLAHAGRRDALVRSMRKYAGLSLALSLAYAVGVALLAAPVVARWRPEYADAVGPAKVLALAAAFMFQNAVLTTALNALGRFRWVASCAAVNLAAYALAGAWLVPAHGAVGAAQATLVTEAVNTLVQLAMVARALREDPARAAAT